MELRNTISNAVTINAALRGYLRWRSTWGDSVQALLGVIALMGMIQRNSVILIDQIEQDRARGVPAWDAIVESAVRRLRPIVLTAAAAVLAMIPLSRSVFWGRRSGRGRGHRGNAAD